MRTDHGDTETVSADVPADVRRIALALPAPASSVLVRAWHVADAGHAGMQRDEGTPFITHPVEVCRMLWDDFACRDVELLCAALLHDVLEDTAVTARDMAAAFGPRVTGLVQAVTKVQVAAVEKAARDEAYMQALLIASPEVRLLKLADRIHNLRMVPLSGDRAKGQRYLLVSRDVFLRMARATDPRAFALLTAACDALERSLDHGLR